MANRILAHGNIERALKFANSLGGWLLHRAFADGYLAHRPQPRWEPPAIEGEEVALRRGNSGHRKKLRRLEKNRGPVAPFKYERGAGLRRPSDNIDLKTLVKVAAGTLYHLIDAIPVAARDALEIYTGDYRTALFPYPQRTNWNARKLERWKRQGISLCGVSSRAALGRDGLGLRDYAEPARLLFSGRYKLVTRQKAASAGQYILATPELAAWLRQQVTPPETQRVLQRIGRLYKNSCYWSEKDPRCLFDECRASSAKVASWGRHRVQDLEGAVLLQKAIDRAQKASGGQVIYLGSPAKRHANLTQTRTAYNEQWGSYLSSAKLSRRLREQRSLNIPRETIEVRNNMIANLEHDFSPRDEAEVA